MDGGRGRRVIGSADKPLPLEIKASGNWTRRGFAKKPFKLKLGKTADARHDQAASTLPCSHMPTTLGATCATSSASTSANASACPGLRTRQPVEVVINGDYRGLYFLTESVRVGDDRIMISELDDDVSDTALASGGYLVELDNYDEENQIRLGEKVAPGSEPIPASTSYASPGTPPKATPTCSGVSSPTSSRP